MLDQQTRNRIAEAYLDGAQVPTTIKDTDGYALFGVRLEHGQHGAVIVRFHDLLMGSHHAVADRSLEFATIRRALDGIEAEVASRATTKES